MSDKTLSKAARYGRGVVIILTGLACSVLSIGYGIGNLYSIGPGFFPLLIGSLLTISGISMLVIDLFSSEFYELQVNLNFRGFFSIVSAIVVFIYTELYLGFIAATFLLILISCRGDKQNKWSESIALSLAVVVSGICVFKYLLELPFPLT